MPEQPTDQPFSPSPLTAYAERPQLDITLDLALLQSIQELSDSDILLVWRDTEGRPRWIRVPRSKDIDLISGCPVTLLEDGESVALEFGGK
jgi:hypothetical protein